MAEPALHGLLVVDKPGLPAAPTSHDVVQQVRRWSRQRRIGHTGTLDPMASGVLVLCLGAATRLVEYYQGHAKAYYAEVELGAATDTYDALGAVVDRQPVPALAVGDIELALAHFRGPIVQQPPAYSALKVDGESLHRRARRGEAVEAAPRRVTIHALELIAFLPPARVQIRLHCSAGTYVRSLAHDLGHVLGTCGHLAALRREAAGAFTLADAHGLPHLQAVAEAGKLADLLLPPGVGLDLPVLRLLPEAARRLGHGQAICLPAPDPALPSGWTPEAPVQGVDDAGRLLGILRCLGDAEACAAAAMPRDEPELLWKADKWLAAL
jgi:tRNA pseudouridine55 synthase